nr:cilia- and flagella-associated protein 52 [Bactrocera oleae]
MSDLLVEVKKLEPRAIFGANGKVENGVQLHPDKVSMIYSLGNKIGIANTLNNKQEFLSGHTHAVSCLTISKSGQYLASGQRNHMGFPAYVIMWDFATRTQLARHDLHKVLVQSISFTADEKCLVSVGGKDDGTVIVLDTEARTPICQTPAARSISGNALTVCSLHNSPSHFIVAGDRHLRMWSIQREQKKLHVHDMHVGKLQRIYTGMQVDEKDEYLYLGTMTGDIVKVALKCCDPVNVTKIGMTASMLGAFGKHNPRKPYGKDCERYVNGVRHLCIVKKGLILVGAGDGTLELVEERKDVTLEMMKNYPSPTWPIFRTLKRANVYAAVTSLVRTKTTSDEFIVSTEQNEIWFLNIVKFSCKLLRTCHSKPVNQIVFPKNLSTVFASAGYQSIRIWSIGRLQEILRIMVYNFKCVSLQFTNDGSSIVSAWNDGVIRAFTPITGRLIYAIPNAHNKGCNALRVSSTGRLLVTGGVEGQVRVWKIEPYRQSLIGVLKDHSGPISSLDFNHLDTEIISACVDGSCVIWDVNRMTRKFVVTSNTQFMCARYFPTGVQLLACGSDGRISYWMVYNGSLIRELHGTKKNSINFLDINATGDYFLTVSSDQTVKMWDYNRGITVCAGYEHSSPVLSCAFSPNGRLFVTGSVDGAIIIWDVPEEFWGKANPPPQTAVPETASKMEAPVQPAPRASKAENIDNLLKSSAKDNVCCVECPPINMKKQPDINCDYIPDIKKC